MDGYDDWMEGYGDEDGYDDGYEDGGMEEGVLGLYPEDEWDPEGSEGQQMMYDYSLSEVLQGCVLPTYSDAWTEVARLLACCVLFRLTTQIVPVPSAMCHIISVIMGVTALVNIFSTSVMYMGVLAVLAYVMLTATYLLQPSWCGISTSLISILYLIVCEFFIVEPTRWHKIRGAQLLVVMKAISLGFDVANKVQKQFPNPVEYMGYIFCPGAIVFGPWVSFKDYQDMYSQKKWNVAWLVKIVTSLVWSFIFLSVSTCWAFFALPEASWRWWLAYRDALSFRCSHYFISFLSEATAVSAGLGSTSDGSWKVQVAKPQEVELPRSLVEVVVCWNKPMHFWLKTYVFKTARPLGNLAAVLATYAASSLLHGLNFQLAAVLLSLGLYTYVEHSLRRHLASVFDACLMARRCKAGGAGEGHGCRHRFKAGHWAVRATNVAFGILAMFHLAYLGVMFDATPNRIEEEGYSFEHTLSKWAALGFASHWVVAFTYLVYLVI